MTNIERLDKSCRTFSTKYWQVGWWLYAFFAAEIKFSKEDGDIYKWVMALAEMRGIDMKNIKRQKNLIRQSGASLVEYGLLVSLICLAAYPALTKPGQKVGLRLCQAAQDSGRADFDVRSGTCVDLTFSLCPFQYRVQSSGSNNYSCLRT